MRMFDDSNDTCTYFIEYSHRVTTLHSVDFNWGLHLGKNLQRIGLTLNLAEGDKDTTASVTCNCAKRQKRKHGTDGSMDRPTDGLTYRVD